MQLFSAILKPRLPARHGPDCLPCINSPLILQGGDAQHMLKANAGLASERSLTR